MNIAIQADTAEVADLRAHLRKANDEARRYRNLWNAVEAGEVDARKHDALTRMAALGSQTAINAALLLENMARWHARMKIDSAQETAKTLSDAAIILRIEAGRGYDILNEIEDGGNLYIMPGDA